MIKVYRRWIGIGVFVTILPAWLLCKLMIDFISPAFSFASRKIRENSMPKIMLWEQPPHFHRYLFFVLYTTRLSSIKELSLLPPLLINTFGVILFFGISIEPHPHDVMIPWLQARVTACATPALKMEYAKLDSRYPKWYKDIF